VAVSPAQAIVQSSPDELKFGADRGLCDCRMIRYVVLSTAVIFLGVYAWRDWYRSLCGLVVLMAFLEHPDMPKTMFGIQGVNLWNLLLLIIVVAWASQRSAEGLTWDAPRGYLLLLMSFFLVVAIGCLRLIDDRHVLATDSSVAGLISEHWINPVKFIIPGLLLFDGSRRRSRLLWGLASILALYLLLSAQVIRWMPIEGMLHPGELARRSQKILRAEVGCYRVDLSVMLAGAFWALLAVQSALPALRRRIFVLLGGLLLLTAEALTAGRSGYVAWTITGLTIGLLRWRRYLLLAPAVMLFVALLPGVSGRALDGFDQNGETNTSQDLDALTSGRSNIWPAVMDKISDAPIAGYGRRAMERIGLSTVIEGEDFVAHPHNAYLEMLLEGGSVGLLVSLALFGYILARSLALIRDDRSDLFVIVGGVTASLVIAQLAGAFTAQSFYPREGTVGMWSAIGLMLRVAVERARGNLNFAAPDAAKASASSIRHPEWWRRVEPS